jgi:ribose transport system ATP-binding protein
MSTTHGQSSLEGQAARSVLTAARISKTFGGIIALRGVDLQLFAGEVHALMGENGAGKSTLMKIVAGVHTDYEGDIFVDGQHVSFASVRDAEAAGIAIIHQELNLVPELTVADNIFLGREKRIAGLVINRKASRSGALALLSRLGINLDPDAKVGALRVGEQQLVEIAKALSLDARVLIMDEPTSALSPAECTRLFKIMKQLTAEGVAIVYISHRIDEVLALADRVTVFRDGRHVLTDIMAKVGESALISAMVGRELMPAIVADRGTRTDPVLSVRCLSLSRRTRRGSRLLLDNVSFDLAPGEILGIGGLLGSGRTEILEAIFGSSSAQVSGEVRIDGAAVRIGSPAEAKRLGLAFVTEDRKTQGLHLTATITDNVALPLVAALSRFGLRAFAREADAAKGAVSSLGIKCGSINQMAGTLSGGNQQKVVMGKWLATKPRILLLDEPTRGIDVGAKREIYDLIFKLATEGLGIIVVSSEMPELLYLSDRILVMAEGRQTGMLSRENASEEQVMQLAAPRSVPGRIAV